MGINNDDIIIVKNMLIDGDNRDKIREMLGKLEIN